MTTKIQLKRGLNANFDPVILSEGEPAFVTDTGKLYVGNGTDKIIINPMDKPDGLNTTSSYTKVKVNEYGQVISLATLAASDIPTIDSSQITGLGTASALDTGEQPDQIPILDASGDLPLAVIPLIPNTQVTGLGSAAIANIGTQSGNVPALDSSGKLLAEVLPSIAITDTFIVSNQTEMLGLNAQVGDIAVRTDLSKTFILQTAPANTLANWVELATPTDSVLSVNGKVGTVVLSSGDISMTGFAVPDSYTPISPADSTSLAIGKLAKNFDSFAPLNSPNLAGRPTAPTAAAADNSNNIATTAFVQTAIAVIDGGVF